MKFILSLMASFLLVSQSFAKDAEPNMKDVTLKCTGKSYYIRSSLYVKLVFDGSDYLGVTDNKSDDSDSWDFSWSQSQCEDNTDLVIDKAELNKLLNHEEKSVSAQLIQAEPDWELKASVECSLSN